MGSFQNVLKSLRKSNGLTQDELAKALKVSRSTIGMYENGSREPDYETLESIADYFNVDIDYLLGRTLKTTKIIKPQTITAHVPKIMTYYDQLNDLGKREATKRVEELTYFPQYSANQVNAAHADDYANAPEELKQLEEDMIDKAFRSN